MSYLFRYDIFVHNSGYFWTDIFSGDIITCTRKYGVLSHNRCIFLCVHFYVIYRQITQRDHWALVPVISNCWIKKKSFPKRTDIPSICITIMEPVAWLWGLDTLRCIAHSRAVGEPFVITRDCPVQTTRINASDAQRSGDMGGGNWNLLPCYSSKVNF